MTDVLSVQRLTKSYPRKVAVDDLSLAVGAGQVYGLLGPNGSGKTTTLGAVLGALRPDRGTVAWFGERNSPRARRRVGALLEAPSFYPWLSGRANLRIVAAVKRLPPGGSLEEPLRQVGLADAGDQAFQSYSLGMKARLALAAALLGRPEVLVLDEPTNGVDAQGIFEIRSVISQFAAQGGTVVLASHMLDEVEKVCSHVAILKDGRLVKTGTIGSVLQTAGWTEVAAANQALLARHVAALEPGARIETKGDVLEIYGGVLPPAVLNERLAARGVYLGHLALRRPSLESQYLALVGGGAT